MQAATIELAEFYNRDRGKIDADTLMPYLLLIVITSVSESQAARAEKQENSRKGADDAKAAAEKKLHDKAYEESVRTWKERADKKQWDCIKANLEVYKFSGED